MSPAALLLLGVFRHEVWGLTSHGALFWNLCGSIVIAIFVLREWRRSPGLPVALVCIWWLYEETLVSVCSAYRIIDWWPVAPGEEQCSARFSFKFGALSLVLLGLLIYKVIQSEHRPKH